MNRKSKVKLSSRQVIARVRRDGQAAGKLRPRQALRGRLALAVKLARRIERSASAAIAFDQLTSLWKIRPTRADGGPYHRILRFVGLTVPAGSLARYDKFVEGFVKSDLPTKMLMERIVKVGPHRATASPRRKLRRRVAE